MNIATMGRFLVVTDVPPRVDYPNGYSARLLHFLRALSARHSVDLLALTAPATHEYFKEVNGLSGTVYCVSPPSSRLLQPTLAGRLARARHYMYDRLPFMAQPRCLPALGRRLSEARPRLVVFYLPHLAHLARYVPATTRVICVLEEGWERALPEATAGLGAFRRRLVLGTEQRRVEHLYRQAGQRSIGVVLISDEERREFARVIPEHKLRVFPHGVDCAYFSAGRNQDDGESVDIGVIADFDQPRNARGIEAVVAALGIRAVPRPPWRWMLVGRGSTETLARLRRQADLRSLGRFEATGRVGDVRPYYQRAKVVLVPDFEGTGVKTTVLQAWAMARPIVATCMATRGLPATPGADLMAGTSPTDILDRISDLLGDQELRRALADKGRATVMEHRNLETIAARFAAYCSQAAARESGGTQCEPRYG